MSKYKEVSFDFLADCITKKVKPQETNIAVYYGLEHLDADSIKIQRCGTPDEVIGEKIHALPGDIIFGKRRAYQRKLGVTGCECIVSAHSMVLRAKSENIVPEFLPYFMQSDVFMERAVMVSEGSLSPTIKWKTLAQEKFVLPDMDTQHEIAELMMAFDDSIDMKRKLSSLVLTTKNTFETNAFTSETQPIKLKDIFELSSGVFLSNNDIVQGECFVYGASGKMNTNNQSLYSEPKLCIGRVGNPGYIFITEPNSWITDNVLIVDRFKIDASFKFIYHLLKYLRLSQYCSKSVQPLITGTVIKNIEVIIPKYEKQVEIANSLDYFDLITTEINEAVMLTLNFKKAILKQLLKSEETINEWKP